MTKQEKMEYIMNNLNEIEKKFMELHPKVFDIQYLDTNTVNKLYKQKQQEKMEHYNQGDEVIVKLQKHVFYHAQVLEDRGDMVDIILKQNTLNERTFLYDKEYGVSKNMIVEKTYDIKTDKYLEEQE